MKNIKIICLILCLLFIYFCSGCTSAQNLAKPEDGDLEFWITDDVANFDWKGHDEISGWEGAHEYLDKRYKSVQIDDETGKYTTYPEYYVSYIITSYPDYSSKNVAVTTINITDPNVTIYGLSINSSNEEIGNKMKELGLKKQDDRLSYIKGNISIHFSKEKITIKAKVTNKQNIQF